MIFLILRIFQIILGVAFLTFGFLILIGFHKFAYGMSVKENHYRDPAKYAVRCGIFYLLIAAIMLACGIGAFFLPEIFTVVFLIGSTILAVFILELNIYLSIKNV